MPSRSCLPVVNPASRRYFVSALASSPAAVPSGVVKTSSALPKLPCVEPRKITSVTPFLLAALTSCGAISLSLPARAAVIVPLFLSATPGSGATASPRFAGAGGTSDDGAGSLVGGFVCSWVAGGLFAACPPDGSSLRKAMYQTAPPTTASATTTDSRTVTARLPPPCGLALAKTSSPSTCPVHGAGAGSGGAFGMGRSAGRGGDVGALGSLAGASGRASSG